MVLQLFAQGLSSLLSWLPHQCCNSLPLQRLDLVMLKDVLSQCCGQSRRTHCNPLLWCRSSSRAQPLYTSTDRSDSPSASLYPSSSLAWHTSIALGLEPSQGKLLVRLKLAYWEFSRLHPDWKGISLRWFCCSQSAVASPRSVLSPQSLLQL